MIEVIIEDKRGHGTMLRGMINGYTNQPSRPDVHCYRLSLDTGYVVSLYARPEEIKALFGEDVVSETRG